MNKFLVSQPRYYYLSSCEDLARIMLLQVAFDLADSATRLCLGGVDRITLLVRSAVRSMTVGATYQVI